MILIFDMKLIKNGLVYTMSDDIPKKLDILIDNDGFILEIDKKIEGEYPFIDASGCNIYPGLIDAHTHLGIIESSIGYEGNDCNEYSDPITPHIRAIDGINILDESIKSANSAGITTVCCTPGSANVLGGQVCIYQTYGNSIDNALLNAYSAQKAAFGENPKRVYRDSKIKTRMQIAALLRENLLKANQYLNKKNFNKEDASKTYEYDMKMEALIPVLERKIPLKVHAHRADDILTVIRIAREFNIDVTLEHCTEAHIIIEHVKDSGFPVIFGPTLTHKTKYELSNRSFNTVNALYDKAILFAITTDSPVIPLEYLPICAGLAKKAGLTEIEALKTITINPAKILKIDHLVGSIKKNKQADLVITDGDILNTTTKVLYTLIKGQVTYKL